MNVTGTHWVKLQAPSELWNSRKIGAGAPPIRVRGGWLLIFYGTDDREEYLQQQVYHLGAMLLDAKDPSRVLYMSVAPILTPSRWYEQDEDGWRVAYTCGAVVVDGKLLVYYGGGDRRLNVASADLKTFLEELKRTGRVALTT